MTDHNSIGKKPNLEIKNPLDEKRGVKKFDLNHVGPATQIDSVDRRESVRSPTQGSSLSTFRETPLVEPIVAKEMTKSMKLNSDIPRLNLAGLQQATEQERKRNRPLIIVFHPEKDDTWVSGFDYLVQFMNGEIVSDWRSIYKAERVQIGVFYSGNQTNGSLSFDLAELKKYDNTGMIAQAILGINAPGTLDSEEAEGLGLLVASIAADRLPSVPAGEAKNLFNMLSRDNQKIALRHALVLSCRLADQPLVNELLNLKADPNVVSDDDGSMPLEIATQKGDVRMVQSLYKHGANPDVKLTSGMTCRVIAEEMQFIEISAIFGASNEKRL